MPKYLINAHVGTRCMLGLARWPWFSPQFPLMGYLNSAQLLPEDKGHLYQPEGQEG